MAIQNFFKNIPASKYPIQTNGPELPKDPNIIKMKAVMPHVSVYIVTTLTPSVPSRTIMALCAVRSQPTSANLSLMGV